MVGWGLVFIVSVKDGVWDVFEKFVVVGVFGMGFELGDKVVGVVGGEVFVRGGDDDEGVIFW